jgi:hypothetical protein
MKLSHLNFAQMNDDSQGRTYDTKWSQNYDMKRSNLQAAGAVLLSGMFSVIIGFLYLVLTYGL